MYMSSHSDFFMHTQFCVHERACKTILCAWKSVHANIKFIKPWQNIAKPINQKLKQSPNESINEIVGVTKFCN